MVLHVPDVLSIIIWVKESIQTLTSFEGCIASLPMNYSLLELDTIIVQLSDAEESYILAAAPALEAALYLLPPTQLLIDLGLVVADVDETARPVPRSGWRTTPLGWEVAKRFRSLTSVGTQW